MSKGYRGNRSVDYRINLLDPRVKISGSLSASHQRWCLKGEYAGYQVYFNQNGYVDNGSDCIEGVAYDSDGAGITGNCNPA